MLIQQGDIVLKYALLFVKGSQQILRSAIVVFDLGLEAYLGLVDQVPVVQPFDAAFPDSTR